MKNKSYIDILNEHGDMAYAVEDRKVKKFFRITIPILILEVLVVIGLLVWLFLLPRNYCKVSINLKNAEVYVNDKETKKISLEEPTEAVTYYYYDINLSVVLPGSEDYLVTFTVKCDKYKIATATNAISQNDVFSMQVKGGVKTQLIDGVTIISSELIKDFEVQVDVNAQKI